MMSLIASSVLASVPKCLMALMCHPCYDGEVKMNNLKPSPFLL